MDHAWVTSRHIPVHLAVYPAELPAPTVVFVHGLTGNAFFYSDMLGRTNFLAALADEGVNVVALDLQGHGLSEGRRGDVSFRDAMENIGEAVSYATGRFGGPVGLAGSSLGGVLAFYAALEDERVRAVACHNAADLRDVSPLAIRWRQRAGVALGDELRALAERLPRLRVPARALISFHDVFEDPSKERVWRRAPRMVWSYTLRSCVSLFQDPGDKPALEAMTKPVLILAGEEDRIFPVATQEGLARRLGASAEVFVLPGAGHMLPLEHLSVTVPKLGEWLRKAL